MHTYSPLGRKDWQRRNYHLFLVQHNTEDLLLLKKLVEEKKFRPIIHKTFDVAKLAENGEGGEQIFQEEEVLNAFRELQSRRVIGKLVLSLKRQ